MNERAAELSQLGSNLGLIIDDTERRLINGGDFVQIFETRLQAINPVDDEENGSRPFDFELEELGISKAKKLAIAVIVNTEQSKEIWIEDPSSLRFENRLHSEAFERYKYSTKNPDLNYLAAYLIEDVEGKRHLLTKSGETTRIHFFPSIPNLALLDAIERYRIETIVGRFANPPTVYTNGKPHPYHNVFEARIIDRDLVEEIRASQMLEKYRQDFQMSEEEFERFKKRSQMALDMNVGINHEILASEITGRNPN